MVYYWMFRDFLRPKYDLAFSKNLEDVERWKAEKEEEFSSFRGEDGADNFVMMKHRGEIGKAETLDAAVETCARIADANEPEGVHIDFCVHPVDGEGGEGDRMIAESNKKHGAVWHPNLK